MIPAFHDYHLEPKITKCGDLLYQVMVHMRWSHMNNPKETVLRKQIIPRKWSIDQLTFTKGQEFRKKTIQMSH